MTNYLWLACSPVFSLALPLMGPATFGAILARSLLMLVVIAVMKSILYARIASAIGISGIALFGEMIVGNVVSTIPGLALGVMFLSPEGLLILFPLPILIIGFGWWQFSPWISAVLPRAKWRVLLIALLYPVHVIGLMNAHGMADSLTIESLSRATLFWTLKAASLAIGLTFGLAITIMFESLAIRQIRNRNRDYDLQHAEAWPIVDSVFRANVWTLLLVVTRGAVLVFPERWHKEYFIGIE